VRVYSSGWFFFSLLHSWIAFLSASCYFVLLFFLPLPLLFVLRDSFCIQPGKSAIPRIYPAICLSLSLLHSAFASTFSCFYHFTFLRISLHSHELGSHSIVHSMEFISSSLTTKDSEISNKKLFLLIRQ